MAYLVHHRGKAVDRHRIMDDLWRDLDADKAAANLNTTVHYLRKNLKSHNIEGILQQREDFIRLTRTESIAIISILSDCPTTASLLPEAIVLTMKKLPSLTGANT